MIWLTFHIFIKGFSGEVSPGFLEGHCRYEGSVDPPLFRVNLKDVWYTVKVDIPALKNEILVIFDVLGTEK